MDRRYPRLSHSDLDEIENLIGDKPQCDTFFDGIHRPRDKPESPDKPSSPIQNGGRDDLTKVIVKETWEELRRYRKELKERGEDQPHSSATHVKPEEIEAIVKEAGIKQPISVATPLDKFHAVHQIWKRPAFLIQDDDIVEVPKDSQWGILNDTRYRDIIRSVLPSVGRIELQEASGAEDDEGTGFMVAEDIVMTNRHVAMKFCHWEGKSGHLTEDIRIDFREEYSGQESEFAITDVIWIYDDFDVAILRVRPNDTASLPPPLRIRREEPEGIEGRKVYAIGYPIIDSDVLAGILLGKGGVKRLQPGFIVRRSRSRKRVFRHDCSTTPNSSGSCIVDLETGNVLGLHFGGHEHEYNAAVALWRFKDDKLMKDIGINFVA